MNGFVTRDGISCFKDTLHPYFVKGANQVCLWLFMQLLRTWRGNGEFVSWVSKKVMETWMGLLHLSAVPQPNDFNFADILSRRQCLLLQGLQDPNERRESAEKIRTEHIDAMKQAHRQTVPLSDNLMSLIFLVQSDLNEQQRERFVTSMSLRQVSVNNYTYLAVKGLFLDLFCGAAAGTADPSIRRGKGRPGFNSRRGKGAGAHHAEYPDNSGFYGQGKKRKKGGKKGFKQKDTFKGSEKTSNKHQQSNVATRGTHMDITLSQTSTIPKM